MFFELSKFNFLTSSEKQIRRFAILVDEGRVSDSVIKEKFQVIKTKKYNEKKAKIIIKNITIASYNVSRERTDYQTLSDEALVHLVKFIKIRGSINLKIIYALFSNVIHYIRYKDKKKKYYFNKKSCGEVNSDFYNRLYYLGNKDQKTKIGKKIKRIYNELEEKEYDSS